MKFIHLHTHSHYSLLDGLIKIDDLINRAKELGMEALALTDHGNLYGAVEFYKKAKKAGIKPILGVEAYLAPNTRFDKRPKIDDRHYHLILLAKNPIGWKNLIKLITKANLEGFYYKPRIDKGLLRQHSEGLIGLSACLSGEIPRLIQAHKLEEARKAALDYQEIFGQGNFYLEVGHYPNIPETVLVKKELVKISKELNIPLVATQDIHYLNPEDAPYHDILLAVQTGHKVGEEDRLSLRGEDFSMRSSESMIENFSDLPEAIENTQKIVEMCNVELELGKIHLPSFHLPPSEEDVNSYLRKLVFKGADEKFSQGLSEEYRDRVEYELGVIDKTGFADYFLIVSDFIKWAKEHGIVVGPGRGSAAGSLVSYVLGITDIDPIKYDLLFERFLNPDRIQMPDIDIDFTDRRRNEVLAYICQKYGQDHVAQIITFGTMAARAAVRDAGRALGISYSLCDRLAKLIPFNVHLREALKIKEIADLYENNDEARRIIDAARKLEGLARHASVHACGVVISQDPLIEYLPLQHAPQDENTIITQFEMNSIEELGLLKMDLLGLKNLTIIEDTIRLIKERRGESIQLKDLPLDSNKAFELLKKGDTTAVFQLECLSGGTIISNTTIKNLYEKKNKKVLNSVYLDKGKVHKNKIINILKRGKKDVYVLIGENNWYIKATKDHYFLTENGWKKLKDIKLGEKILLKTKAAHLVYNVCSVCGKQINGQKEGKSNFCYKCSAAFYRNPSKKESRKKIKEARIRFYQEGGKPWNYGVTTENNEIWKNTALKISKALTGKSLEDRLGVEKANEIKKVLSERFRGINNPMFGKTSPHRKGGFREDLGHYVRSNWEADFARILRLYNSKYKYEPKTFPLVRANGGVINYTPDFYVETNNTFYEIKGWFHDLDREKIELFRKQYPQYNLILVNTTKFAELALKYKHLIKWECPRIPIKNSFQFIEVKQIKYSGQEETYDIVMESPGNNFVANGFVVHNSSGMRRYLKELKPSNLEDIIAVVALYRPGPLEAGMVPKYIARKHGKEKVEYLHPKLEPILGNTYGIGVYQEQMMRIARDLAGFSLAEADTLRKAIGKKIKILLESQKEKLIKGMVENGIDEKTAKKIWELFPSFARYGFNRSHAACYAMIGYQTAYLKAHYPIEFMTSLLNAESGDTDRIAFLAEEAKKMGIEILPPDINQSGRDFSPDPSCQVIRFGLNAVKNLGSNIVEAIISERGQNGPFQNVRDFLLRITHKDLNKKSLESLIKCGALDSLEVEKGTLLYNIEELLRFNNNSKRSLNNNQHSLFTKEQNISPLRLKEAPVVPLKEKLAWEKELLGIFVSEHPLNGLEEKLKNFKVIPIKDIFTNQAAIRYLNIAGIISKIQMVMTKLGQPMIFAKLNDLSSSIEVVVFSDVLSKDPTVWQENNTVMIKGKMSQRNGESKLICSEARLI